MLPELERIDRYRLDRDLTWAALSAEMRAADLEVAGCTLHRHCKRSPDAPCNDRTLYKIRQFLRLKRITVPSGRRRRRSSARLAHASA